MPSAAATEAESRYGGHVVTMHRALCAPQLIAKQPIQFLEHELGSVEGFRGLVDDQLLVGRHLLLFPGVRVAAESTRLQIRSQRK